MREGGSSYFSYLTKTDLKDPPVPCPGPPRGPPHRSAAHQRTSIHDQTVVSGRPFTERTACILRTTVFARNGDATRPHGHTSPHAHARSLAAASPSPDAVLMRLAAQRSNVLGLHSGPTAVDGCASVNSIRSWVLCARSWVRSEAASAGGVPFEPHSRSLTAVQHRQRLQDSPCASCRGCVVKACQELSARSDNNAARVPFVEGR